MQSIKIYFIPKTHSKFIYNRKSRLLINNLKIKIYKTIIFRVLLYGRVITLTLRE